VFERSTRFAARPGRAVATTSAVTFGLLALSLGPTWASAPPAGDAGRSEAGLRPNLVRDGDLAQGEPTAGGGPIPGSDWIGSPGPASIQQDVPTQPGVSYQLSFRVRAISTSSAAQFYDITFGTTTMSVPISVTPISSVPISVMPIPGDPGEWWQATLETAASTPTTRLTITRSDSDAGWPWAAISGVQVHRRD
jgi:hypothetical protein